MTTKDRNQTVARVKALSDSYESKPERSKEAAASLLLAEAVHHLRSIASSLNTLNNNVLKLKK